MSIAKRTVMDDIKSLKGFILGVIAFGVAVSGFLVQAFHLDTALTIFLVTVIAIIFVSIGLLIQRSETRQLAILEAHIDSSDKQVEKITVDLTECMRSNLRVEMNQVIYNHPENHDTILKMAYRYFIVLKGDWVETDVFLTWIETEEEAGRKVHVPANLANAVAVLQKTE